MAVDNYKNEKDISISTNKGVRIDEADLKIFSRENTDAYFGLSEKDNIEFSLYDTNNNLLGYAIKPDNQIQLRDGNAQVSGQPAQILLDPKSDINALGFQTGNFKVSYQFFRNKFGSYLNSERAYIQEISPSREEIRILPVMYGNDNDTNRKTDFEQFKLNILDNISLSKMIDDVLKLDNAELTNNTDTLFIQQFQKEFNFNNNQLVQLYNQITTDLKTQLIEVLKDEEYPSLAKIKNLFGILLSDILTNRIPNATSETNNILDTVTSSYPTLEDLSKRITQDNKDITTTTIEQPLLETITITGPPEKWLPPIIKKEIPPEPEELPESEKLPEIEVPVVIEQYVPPVIDPVVIEQYVPPEIAPVVIEHYKIPVADPVVILPFVAEPIVIAPVVITHYVPPVVVEPYVAPVIAPFVITHYDPPPVYTAPVIAPAEEPVVSKPVLSRTTSYTPTTTAPTTTAPTTTTIVSPTVTTKTDRFTIGAR